MIRSFIFVKLLKQHLTRSVSNARFLCSDLRSSQRSESQQFCIITHPTSNHLKSSSCVWSLTNGGSLVFPTLTLVRAMLRQAGERRECKCSHASESGVASFKYNSALRIFLRKLWASSSFQWISVNKINFTIRWIMIYPVDSAIHILKNWGLKLNLFWLSQNVSSRSG